MNVPGHPGPGHGADAGAAERQRRREDATPREALRDDDDAAGEDEARPEPCVM